MSVRLNQVFRCALFLAAGMGLAGHVAQVAAQSTGDGEAIKVAIIDVQRILTESALGRESIASLKKSQDEKLAEAKAKQGEINDLQARITEGQLSLAEDRLRELQSELEVKVRDLRRFQEDADRLLAQQRDEAFAGIERGIMPVISAIGKEFGYTLIFNKFQSGLVYADEAVDVTELVIERFDASSTQEN